MSLHLTGRKGEHVVFFLSDRFQRQYCRTSMDFRSSRAPGDTSSWWSPQARSIPAGISSSPRPSPTRNTYRLSRVDAGDHVCAVVAPLAFQSHARGDARPLTPCRDVGAFSPFDREHAQDRSREGSGGPGGSIATLYDNFRTRQLNAMEGGYIYTSTLGATSSYGFLNNFDVTAVGDLEKFH